MATAIATLMFSLYVMPLPSGVHTARGRGAQSGVGFLCSLRSGTHRVSHTALHSARRQGLCLMSLRSKCYETGKSAKPTRTATVRSILAGLSETSLTNLGCELDDLPALIACHWSTSMRTEVATRAVVGVPSQGRTRKEQRVRRQRDAGGLGQQRRHRHTLWLELLVQRVERVGRHRVRHSELRHLRQAAALSSERDTTGSVLPVPGDIPRSAPRRAALTPSSCLINMHSSIHLL